MPPFAMSHYYDDTDNKNLTLWQRIKKHGWKATAIEKARESLVKKLQEEQKKKLDEAMQYWITNKK